MLSMGVVPIGFNAAKKFLGGLTNGYDQAMSEAINRALLAGRTSAAKNIRAKYAIKSSDLKASGLEIKKATYQHKDGSLSIKSGPLNVGLFTAKVRIDKGGKQHVSVVITRGTRRTVVGGFRLPDDRVWKRKPGAARFPIAPVSTIGASQMASSKEISAAIEKSMNTTLETRLKHNVDLLMSAAGENNEKVRVQAKAKPTVKEIQEAGRAGNL
jgi:hypothetical protein